MTPAADYTRPLNFISELQQQARRLSGIRLCDLTLREGEQAASIAFSLGDKVLLAGELQELGVHQLQVGFGGRDNATVAQMKSEGVRVPIELICPAFLPAWKDEITSAIDCGADVIQVLMRSPDRHLAGMGLSREVAAERVVEAIRHAREHGARSITFQPSFASQADLAFVKHLCGLATKAGADIISVADSLGVCRPAAFAHLVKEVRSATDVPLGVHCHNDYGLAVACTLAGLEAGATWADVTIGGIGERAGNASLEQVVLSLSDLYGVDSGIRRDRLSQVADAVAGVVGRPFPENAPVIGDAVFAQKLDSHVWTAVDAPYLFEPYDPGAVGNHRWIAIGKGSGPYALRAKLQEMGLEADEQTTRRLVAWANDHAEQTKRCVSDDELVSAWRTGGSPPAV